MSRQTVHRVPSPGRPSPTAEAAAEWVILLDKGELSEAEQRRFERWLDADEAHVSAYEDALWAFDVATRHAGEAELLELRRAALAARGSRNRAWTWAGSVGAAAAAAAAAIAFVAMPRVESPADAPTQVATKVVEDPRTSAYRTAIGQRSTINLPDGSVATLDTDSQLRVAYSETERAVHLLNGQALFEVAHGKELPFRVYARGQQITAIGTAFNVRLDGNKVRVAMLQGSVRVRAASPASAGSASAREITLVAGESAVTSPVAPPIVNEVEVNEVGMWRQGQLVLDDVPLSEAVAEINRYTTRPISLSDASIARYRVSGVFMSNDPERFARAMTDILPVEAVMTPGGSMILRTRSE